MKQQDGRKIWRVIGRGRCGWHAESADSKTSSSGGFLLPYEYCGRPCPGYAAEAVEGALVYDAKDADADLFPRFVISGPILDCALPPGHVHGLFADPVKYDPLRHIIGSGFGSFHAALDVWEGLLRAVPGIRFGTIKEGSVVWESEPAPLTWTAAAPRKWSVVVGNIGTVYDDTDEYHARQTYFEYVDQSQRKTGSRAYGEQVTLFVDGEPVQEFDGTPLEEEGE